MSFCGLTTGVLHSWSSAEGLVEHHLSVQLPDSMYVHRRKSPICWSLDNTKMYVHTKYYSGRWTEIKQFWINLLFKMSVVLALL